MTRRIGPKPTLEEFERGYAKRSRLTVEWLHAHEIRAHPCNCGDESCDGWQMLSDDSWLAETDFEAWKKKHGYNSTSQLSVLPAPDGGQK